MKYDKFKVYLYFCMSAFFLILAMTLYYSFGYKYDPTTGKSIQTGAIVVRTTPNDAIITKDGQEIPQQGFPNNILSSFTKIEDLDPTSYTVKASKEGYLDWQKSVKITPGQVEKYENIVLLKKEYKEPAILLNVTLPDPAKSWISTEKNRIIFYGTVDAQEGLFFIDLQDEGVRLVLDKSQLALMGEIQSVKWTEDDNKIILKAANIMSVIDLGDGDKVYTISSDVAKILSQTPDSPIYIYNQSIIFPQNGAAYLFDYTTKKTKKAVDGVSNFYVHQGNLYFFKTESDTKNIALFSVNLGDSLHENRVSYMPADYNPKSPFTIKKENNSVMILSNGSLYLTGTSDKAEKINSGVKEARFFQSGKKIIYFSDNEIWIYYVEDKTSQPIKSKGDNELLTRFSGKISNIYTYSDDEHIFFQENNMFKFVELDGRDQRNIFDVLDNTDNREIFYLGNKNLIYFIKGNKFYKIDLKEV
jgi:hypothetical protein